MLREIYCRDESDPKYNRYQLETSDKLEIVLNKVRMILLTNRGEVLGEPFLGLDLEDYIFQTSVNEGEIKNRFNAQVAQYIPEGNEFEISLNISVESDGVKDTIYLYIYIDNLLYMGIQA